MEKTNGLGSKFLFCFVAEPEPAEAGTFGRSRFECPAPSPAPSELWTLFTFVVQHWLNSIKKQIIKNLWIFFSQEGGVLLKLKMFLISWKLTFLLEPGSETAPKTRSRSKTDRFRNYLEVAGDLGLSDNLQGDLRDVSAEGFLRLK